MTNLATMRNQQLDGTKYLLICLVVLCHLMQGVRYANPVFQCIYSVVYSFHMPLFVLLSGFFFHKQNAADIHHVNLKLLEPLILYHLLFVHSTNWKNYLFFEPSPLWYLLSLICWRWIVFGIEQLLFVLRKGNNNKKHYINVWGGGIIVITISISLSFVAMFVIKEKYSCFLSLMRTFQFLPFFAIGHVLTEDSLIKLQSWKTMTILMMMTLITVVFLCLFSGPQLNAFLFSKYNLYSLSTIVGNELFSTLGLKVVLMIASLILCFAMLCVRSYPEWLSSKGENTLFIFCVHTPIYYFTQGITNEYIALFVAVGSLVALTVLSRTKIANWLLYPLTCIRNSYIK